MRREFSIIWWLFLRQGTSLKLNERVSPLLPRVVAFSRLLKVLSNWFVSSSVDHGYVWGDIIRRFEWGRGLTILREVIDGSTSWLRQTRTFVDKRVENNNMAWDWGISIQLKAISVSWIQEPLSTLSGKFCWKLDWSRRYANSSGRLDYFVKVDTLRDLILSGYFKWALSFANLLGQAWGGKDADDGAEDAVKKIYQLWQNRKVVGRSFCRDLVNWDTNTFHLHARKLGKRSAIISNGLLSGGTSSGESQIRCYIFENDLWL